MTDYGEISEWSLNSVPRYKKLLHVVEDVKKRGLLESIIDEFNDKVVPKMAQLRKGKILSVIFLLSLFVLINTILQKAQRFIKYNWQK